MFCKYKYTLIGFILIAEMESETKSYQNANLNFKMRIVKMMKLAVYRFLYHHTEIVTMKCTFLKSSSSSSGALHTLDFRRANKTGPCF